MSTGLPEVLRIGPARLTAGLDRWQRLDLAAHRAVFGSVPRPAAAQLIDMADEVSLGGRGGAAFPVARKLRMVRSAAASRRRQPVILVNAAEGEPGSAKDKSLLFRSPHLVLDGALIAAEALNARRIVLAVAGAGPHTGSVRAAVKADPGLAGLVKIVTVPARFVAGEGGALVNAVNGKPALPPGRKTRASERGVDGLPTFLSNAETFAQLALLAMLGPDGYASVGAAREPGTLLLTVGGCARRPAVVEAPYGTPLGEILDVCEAAQATGVLVGGYHGAWLPAGSADTVPVSRAGLAAARGILGPGVVLPLGPRTCPLGEVTRVAAYLAKESSGQCGPCLHGLPAVARSVAALVRGSGGMDAVDAVRRQAAAIRGRGACAHPDGAFRFVASALDVFADDLTAHAFRGTCGRPVLGTLPLGLPDGDVRLTVDWTRCRGHGLCANLVPELVQLDAHGYPDVLGMPVPAWLTRKAARAVEMCPALALRLTAQPAAPDAVPAAGEAVWDDVWDQDLAVTESWIAEIGGTR
jgi:NADH:ubiquinone oxidoreductase subunit F (NADH-binding)/ferredoxin